MCFYKFMGVSEIFKLRGGVPQPVAVMEARGGANVNCSGKGRLRRRFRPAQKQNWPINNNRHSTRPQPPNCAPNCSISFFAETISCDGLSSGTYQAL